MTSPNGIPVTVEGRYLLLTAIPAYVDGTDGSVWLERRWHRDLTEHTSYIRDLTVCAPRQPRECRHREDLVRIVPQPPHRLSFRFLPAQTSYGRAALSLPRTIKTIWSAITASDIVHSSVIGWPFPLGWIANPIAVARGRRLIIVIESAWRMRDLERRRPLQRLLDLDMPREIMARWSCRHADLALFTHKGYRDALCSAAPQAFVAPAVWINESDIVNEKDARARWAELRKRPVSLLFVGRLTAAKGLDILLQAINNIDLRGHAVQIRVLGEGDTTSVRSVARTLKAAKLDVLDPVPYGPALFQLLAHHHAVIVPSLSDEQPRIVFDAFAQAVPVIASDTAGLHAHVHQDETGWLFPPGDSNALADTIVRAMSAPEKLESMGLQAREAATGFTHRGMHQNRARLISEHCQPRAAHSPLREATPTRNRPRGHP